MEKDKLVRRALLGDHEAAKWLTEAGVLVPCPWCGKMVVHAGTIAEHEYMDEDAPGYDWCATHYDAVCDATNGGCGGHTGPYKTEEEACLAWNTRAPILSESEMEMLDAKD